MSRNFILLLIFSFSAIVVHAQSISGVINIYTAVSDVDGVNITVTSTTGFAVGDRVLIIQMKGAEIDESSTDAFGDVVDYHNAGFYEFADVVFVGDSVITIETPLCHTFDMDGRVQLIRVPVYDNVTITGEVTADAWDGEKGGVVVLEVTGTLTMAADINVSGQGFHGGGKCYGFFGCADLDYYNNYSGGGYGECAGGEKGEGITEIDESKSGGRWKRADGGGGSNSGQNGGGGGSNFGAGGRSAFEWTGCGVYDDVWATGGVAMDYALDRIFLGGGGGGGHQDNGLSVTDGSNGGGIVIINAATIDGAGFSINANGDDVTIVTDSEGAGGAGAGGSVVLRVDDFTSALNINAYGGNGGDILSTLWAGTCHGPGGGGGGGYVGYSLGSVPAPVVQNLAGGEAGIITSDGAFCDGTTHGAEDGDTGGNVFNLGELIFPEVDLGPDITVCEGDLYTLDAGEGYASYDWSTGDSTQEIEVTDAGEYIITITNAYGCKASDSINILLYAAAEISLPDSLEFCEGESYVLDAGEGFVSYIWQDGSTAQTYTVNEAGDYTVTVVNSDGCEATVPVNVITFPLPQIDLGGDTALCAGVKVELDAFSEGATYMWNTGETTSAITVDGPGVYKVNVKSAEGCEISDTKFIYDPCGGLIIPSAFSPNGDGMNDDFKPVVQSPIGSLYQFEIWSRWGELLFTSYDITKGWDGTYKNVNSEIDTYIWVVHYTKENCDIEIIEKGFVTLVR